ncbi:MAG: hypothetical protein ACOX4E_07410 [Anaerovoracaceae bacterium]
MPLWLPGVKTRARGLASERRYSISIVAASTARGSDAMTVTLSALLPSREPDTMATVPGTTNSVRRKKSERTFG